MTNQWSLNMILNQWQVTWHIIGWKMIYNSLNKESIIHIFLTIICIVVNFNIYCLAWSITVRLTKSLSSMVHHCQIDYVTCWYRNQIQSCSLLKYMVHKLLQKCLSLWKIQNNTLFLIVVCIVYGLAIYNCQYRSCYSKLLCISITFTVKD